MGQVGLVSVLDVVQDFQVLIPTSEKSFRIRKRHEGRLVSGETS